MVQTVHKNGYFFNYTYYLCLHEGGEPWAAIKIKKRVNLVFCTQNPQSLTTASRQLISIKVHSSWKKAIYNMILFVFWTEKQMYQRPVAVKAVFLTTINRARNFWPLSVSLGTLWPKKRPQNTYITPRPLSGSKSLTIISCYSTLY